MRTGMQSDLPDLSEAAHWPPFQNATITYIHNTYPVPWSLAAEKLVVFLLGLVSHDVADVSIWVTVCDRVSALKGLICVG